MGVGTDGEKAGGGYWIEARRLGADTAGEEEVVGSGSSFQHGQYFAGIDEHTAMIFGFDQ